MWSVFFLVLSYVDADFSRTEPSAPDAPQKNLRRVKRGFTYPGTLWCGAGNIAENYEQLGDFAETDKCCRTHDHCPHVIHAFSSEYGFTNFKWHSISHCDCDSTLTQCLRAVNDTASRVVGQAYFNVIEVPCFEFSVEEKCVERHWYGVCKKYDKVSVAVVKQSIPYDFGGIEVIDALPFVPSKNKPDQDVDKQEESRRSESTTQSSYSGSKSPTPEEPSLTNVVTAAEDFIKVLATVSTSQGSSAEEDKSETQNSDKKRKKNGSKKKKILKKRRGRGKGKSISRNAGTVSKTDDGVTGAPSANMTEELINKNGFVQDQDWAGKKNGNLNFESVSGFEHPNKMMSDEHHGISNNERQKATLDETRDVESVRLVPTSPIFLTIASRPRHARIRQRKRQRHPVPASLPAEFPKHNTMTDNNSGSSGQAGPTTHPTEINQPEEAVQLNGDSQNEKGPAITASVQNAAIVGTKRPRIRHRGGRKKSRRLGAPSFPTEDSAAEESLMTDTDGGSERLQANPPETGVGRSLTDISGDIQPKKRQPRLKGSGDRRRTGQHDANTSIIEDTTRPAHGTRTVTVTRTSAVSDLHLADAQAGQTTGLFPYVQTIAPSMTPLRTRGSKHSIGKKRRKNKRNE